MPLKLKVTSGSLQGREFDIKPGVIVGRGPVNISLNDSKVSGKHAKIEKSTAGEWALVDLGSRNGLVVGGVRKMRVKLTVGTKFKVGNTAFEVIEAEDSAKPAPVQTKSAIEIEAAEPPAIEKNQVPQAPSEGPPAMMSAPLPDPAPPAQPEKPALTGFDYLGDFSARSLRKVKNKPVELGPLNPLLVLAITHGVQAGTEWVIGYGPREIGLDALDYVLLDPDSPGLAFTVSPDDYEARFTTTSPNKVLLNDRSVSTEKLRDGDVITVAATRIKVSFRE